MVYQTEQLGKPGYKRDLLQGIHLYLTLSLRSSAEQQTYEPRIGLQSSWAVSNSSIMLPEDVGSNGSLRVATFKKALTTHSFTKSYDVTNLSIEDHFRCQHHYFIDEGSAERWGVSGAGSESSSRVNGKKRQLATMPGPRFTASWGWMKLFKDRIQVKHVFY